MYLRPVSWSLGVPLFDNGKHGTPPLSSDFNQKARKPPMADRLLVSAVESGSRLRVAFALTMGANIETQHSKPLLTAAARGDVPVIKALLKAHALVEGQKGEFYRQNQYNAIYDTPLRLAIQGGHQDAVKVLLEHGACTKGRFWSAENDARESGHPEIVALLKQPPAAQRTSAPKKQK